MFFKVSNYAQCLGHFEFKTLLMSSNAFCKRPNLSVPDNPISCTCRIGISKFFSGTKKFLHVANLQATMQAAGFLQVLPKSSFKKLLLSIRLWQHAKMSTTLKSPDRLKNSKCKKWQLGNQKPIPYVTETDIVMPKEEPQSLKVFPPQHAHILPWEHQEIPYAHSCSPSNH
jgi:hypothetical protein